MTNFLLTAGPTPVVHIHIPKTGGSSIRGCVVGGRHEGVFGFKQYEGPVYGSIPADWKSYWKFAFVRHPMMRWWSAYRDFKHLRGYAGSPDQFAEETIAQRDPANMKSIAHHTEPQTSPSLCLDRADDVFYYGSRDEYEEAVKAVCARAGLEAPKRVPRLRETPPTREDALSAAMERRLREFYARDYEELGYAS